MKKKKKSCIPDINCHYKCKLNWFIVFLIDLISPETDVFLVIMYMKKKKTEFSKEKFLFHFSPSYPFRWNSFGLSCRCYVCFPRTSLSRNWEYTFIMFFVGIFLFFLHPKLRLMCFPYCSRFSFCRTEKGNAVCELKMKRFVSHYKKKYIEDFPRPCTYNVLRQMDLYRSNCLKLRLNIRENICSTQGKESIENFQR